MIRRALARLFYCPGCTRIIDRPHCSRCDKPCDPLTMEV